MQWVAAVNARGRWKCCAGLRRREGGGGEAAGLCEADEEDVILCHCDHSCLVFLSTVECCNRKTWPESDAGGRRTRFVTNATRHATLRFSFSQLSFVGNVQNAGTWWPFWSGHLSLHELARTLHPRGGAPAAPQARMPRLGHSTPATAPRMPRATTLHPGDSDPHAPG